MRRYNEISVEHPADTKTVSRLSADPLESLDSEKTRTYSDLRVRVRRMGLTDLSRWRHGFESRWGCKHAGQRVRSLTAATTFERWRCGALACAESRGLLVSGVGRPADHPGGTIWGTVRRRCPCQRWRRDGSVRDDALPHERELFLDGPLGDGAGEDREAVDRLGIDGERRSRCRPPATSVHEQ